MKGTAAAIAIFVGLGAFSATSAAQNNSRLSESFPQRPVRWIAPFPPGGAADIVSRLIGQKLTEAWGQQIVVDNRPGAGGNVGTEIAARAAPDGYTVVLVPATFTTYPSLTKKPAYDPLKDFTPITLVSSSPTILVVNPSLPVKNVQDLIALARAKPGELNYASSGIGASAHMAAELFKSMTKTNIVHVPYKGQPPALLDLMSGRVQIMFPNIPVALPHIKSGRLRALAVSTAKRSALFPELPTIAESGLPGFEVLQWSGLMAPAGTAKGIVAKYQRDIAKTLKLPDVRQSLKSQGFEAVGNTPAEFSDYIRAEIRKWAKVIREAGIRPD